MNMTIKQWKHKSIFDSVSCPNEEVRGRETELPIVRRGGNVWITRSIIHYRFIESLCVRAVGKLAGPHPHSLIPIMVDEKEIEGRNRVWLYPTMNVNSDSCLHPFPNSGMIFKFYCPWINNGQKIAPIKVVGGSRVQVDYIASSYFDLIL